MRVDAAAVARSARRGLQRLLGRDAHLDTADRRVLEEMIIPYYAALPSMQRILFVGCAPFTSHYGALFNGRDYWTIDPVARRRRFGSPNHVVGRLEEADRLFGAGQFDLVICNGVLGWGLNRADDAERAFRACEVVLAHGGELVIGWNNVAGRRAVKPETLDALRAFDRITFPPLERDVVEVAGRNRHTYEFFRKPRARL